MSTSRNLVMPLALLLLALLAGGGYWFFRDYFEPPEALILSPDDCDLQKQSCRRSLPGGGELEFSITPRPIPLVSPLDLQVEVKGLEVRGVEVDFSGVTMNMGYNRPRLQKVSGTLFKGEGLLPVCIRQRMDWEARVI
ncbi:MAG TPA: hypothetical protein EYP90_11415, partial [Chromatiaceae bacterium]|nr:hypothetical protein [Chromatiaceae bacterium]